MVLDPHRSTLAIGCATRDEEAQVPESLELGK